MIWKAKIRFAGVAFQARRGWVAGILCQVVWGGASCARHVEVRRSERADVRPIVMRAAANGLVNVVDVDPTILVDLRYATADNVTGAALYPPEMPCLVSVSTGQRLRRAQEYLRERGYGLRIWDAYRPPEAHLKLWRAHSHGLFVSDPKSGWSKHCYGRAVDVTLVSRFGRPVPMPTGFDDFSNDAYFVYSGPRPHVARNLRLLQAAMKHAGFTFLDTEWWHFNDARVGEKMLGEPIRGRDLGIRIP